MKPLAVAFVLFLVAGVVAAPATRPGKPGQAGETMKIRLADIDFTGRTAKEAVAAIAAKSGVEVDVDWKAIEASGATTTAKLRGRLMDVSVRQALQYVLTEIDADGAAQTEMAKDQLVVTVKEEQKKVETRVYSVGPQLERMASERAGVMPKNTPPNELREAAIDHLIRMISTHVAPDTWRDAGGLHGTISITGTRMTVTNTRAALKQFEAYLKELDKPRR